VASSRNEEEAKCLLEFCIKDGSIRDVNSMEEYINKLSKNSKSHLKKNF